MKDAKKRQTDNQDGNKQYYLNCLLRSSSPEGQTVGYVTARYPETTNVEYPERQNMTFPLPPHPFGLLSEVGNVESAQTFPSGCFFQLSGHA